MKLRSIIVAHVSSVGTNKKKPLLPLIFTVALQIIHSKKLILKLSATEDDYTN